MVAVIGHGPIVAASLAFIAQQSESKIFLPELCTAPLKFSSTQLVRLQETPECLLGQAHSLCWLYSKEEICVPVQQKRSVSTKTFNKNNTLVQAKGPFQDAQHTCLKNII